MAAAASLRIVDTTKRSSIKRFSSIYDVDVVVIGAGLSGLKAAADIAASSAPTSSGAHGAGNGLKELSVKVLEASDRVGGKTLSVSAHWDKGPYNETLERNTLSNRGNHATNLAPVATVDLGAAWINDTNQSYMWALVKKLGLEDRAETQNAEGTRLHQGWDGDVSKTTAPNDEEGNKKKEKPPGPPTSPAIAAFTSHLDSLISSTNREKPWLTPNADHLDSITLEQYGHHWYQNHHKEIAASSTSSSTSKSEAENIQQGILDYLSFWTQAFLGVEPEEMSALFFCQYVACGGGLEIMGSDRKDGGQFLRLRSGMQTFSNLLSRGLDVHLSTPVSAITQWSQNDCTVYTTTGLMFHCKRIILSIPTPLYPTITFNPPLPTAKHELSLNTTLGYTSKAILIYSEPWWRSAGLSGSFDSRIGPVAFGFDTCNPEDGLYAFTLFIVGDKGRRWSKFPAAERRRRVLEQIRTIYESALSLSSSVSQSQSQSHSRQTIQKSNDNNNDNNNNSNNNGNDKTIKVPIPTNYIEREWTSQPHLKGCPCPIYPPGILTSDMGKSLTSPFDNVHFVGTETASVWKGYMEGAVRSGERGAREVRDALLGCGSVSGGGGGVGDVDVDVDVDKGAEESREDKNDGTDEIVMTETYLRLDNNGAEHDDDAEHDEPDIDVAEDTELWIHVDTK